MWLDEHMYTLEQTTEPINQTQLKKHSFLSKHTLY